LDLHRRDYIREGTMTDRLERLGQLGVIPVVKIERVEDVLKLGRALLDGGLPAAEITFRTAVAVEAIGRLASELPELLVGAGTVLRVEQAEQAVSAGAKFIVSPGFSPKVVDWSLEHGVPAIPGVCTPTEINSALDRGLTILKFFPAGVMGGPKALEAIAAAYGDVRFIPTGGVDASNLADYSRMPEVHACGGSWMVKASLIASGDFDRISALAREARSIVDEARS
jgi:2-dehydro-3-deoxyphosphogluconate aldolase / (4S)-4-hydroxy-2-oxoglutarate aldolase